jgi:hypothetical protein
MLRFFSVKSNMPSNRRRVGIDEKPNVSIIDTLRLILSFIRTDFGGPHKNTTIRSRLNADGIPINSDTERAYICGATNTRDTIMKYLYPQIKHLKNLIGI